MVDQSSQTGSIQGGSSQGGQTAPLPSVEDLKTHAARAADEAKTSLSAIAEEARSKVNSVVDTQKAAGADQLSGLARAAQTAAGDLEGQSPAVAKLVRDAASSVDRFAGDLRNSDVRDVLASVTDFARQQPVAFFAGSVLLGFAVARFLKSDMPSTGTYRAGGAGSGYRDWSTSHQNDGSV